MFPEPVGRSRRVATIGLSVLVGCFLLTACSGGPSATASTSAKVKVVAAENFYGDIVRQLGGPYVSVTSILSDPEADPHLFEPGTANGAAVADARLVIDNGLGYDAFMGRLLDASPNPHRVTVTVAEQLGIAGTDANPHIWYDVPRLPDIARAIADGLARVDPAHRGAYQRSLSAFDASLSPLQQAVRQIEQQYGGAPVAYTEPVPAYLLQAAGLVAKTPEDFALAIEEGNDPSPQAVAAMRALLTQNEVRVLLYNSQATSPITEQLQQLAQDHGIPVVPVTETLPPGMSFQQWQLGQVQALADALAG